MYNGTEFIYCDAGSETYIKKQIIEYRDYNFENKVYFISPQKFNNNYDAMKEITEWYSTYNSHDLRDDFELLPYKSKVDFLSFKNVDKPKIYSNKNPVIIFDNRTAEQIKTLHDIYLCRAAFYNHNQQEWNKIFDRKDINKNLTYKNNVYEVYSNELMKIKEKSIYSIILAVAILLIEGFIIKMLIYYEFVISGMELVIKKVLGYSLFSKYKKIIKLTVFSALLNLLVLGCYYGFTNTSSLIFVFLGIILFALIDFTIIGFYIRKMERINLQKVLNGAMI